MAIGYICPCCGEKLTREELMVVYNNNSDDTGNNDTNNKFDPTSFFCKPCTKLPANPPPDMSVHTIPLETPVVELKASEAFNMLTDKEKKYAYGIGKASWEGAKINLIQCSVESVPIFSLLQLLFSTQSVQELVIDATATGKLSKEDVSQIIIYSAAFYNNMGNYKSFGDTKFIPAVSPEKFEIFLSFSKADQKRLKQLWDECCNRMYSLTPRQRQMGLGKSKGITTYFSANCDTNDATISNSFLDSIQLSAYNTRLFKSIGGDYTIRIASSSKEKYEGKSVHEYEGKKFTITRGDYSPLMGRVVSALQNDAMPYAANDNQINMIQEYIESFESGNHDAHKDGSRYWIKDTGPVVESYIGFIESYRDPSGVRGEWEGFVACVNKEVSRKFQLLVDNAKEFLCKLPWSEEFEKERFLRPDFTSLEILSFGSSGVPAGINIPNYDEIRQNEGFKNVSLGNVLQASYGAAKDKKVTFVSDNDQELFKALKSIAFEVQVGIHELLGHGSGNLYHVGTDNTKKLIDSNIPHPITGERPIKGPFYATGATWNSTFGKISSTYEECRAECCGIYLCLEKEILDVFGVKDKDENVSINDVSYINWLLMARAGLTGLEFYSPATKEWRQAHMQARFVILRLLLEAENDKGKLLTLEEKINDNDGKPDVTVTLNRELIPSLGKKVVGDFLCKLNVYKSLGDFENGSRMYNDYSMVSGNMIKLREIVMLRKEPRKLLVQPHMKIKNNSNNNNIVELVTFDASAEGMIESFKARFPAEDEELMKLYNEEKSIMLTE